MASFRDDLRVSPEACASGRVRVAEVDGQLAGFYTLAGKPPRGLLDDLFIDPGRIGTGIGRLLWNTAIDHARHLGFTALEIHSDPFAEAFYLHMGAIRIGFVPSESVADRELPLLEIPIPRR